MDCSLGSHVAMNSSDDHEYLLQPLLARALDKVGRLVSRVKLRWLPRMEGTASAKARWLSGMEGTASSLVMS